MATRAELLAAIKTRYRASGMVEKRRILDEFVAVAGYHRKHAIRLLREKPLPTSVTHQPYRVYGAGVREALVVLWEASDRLCSKRLKPMLPLLLPSLVQHGKFELDDEVRTRLLTVSAATIDRLLSEVWVAAVDVDGRGAVLRFVVRFRFAHSMTGVIRRRGLSRPISSPMAARRSRAASS
jgi:hypothetical protein